MNIKIQYQERANEKTKADAQVMADRLQEKVQPLADMIEQQNVQLTLYFLEAGACRLIIDGSREVQKARSDWVGSPEAWG